jgi:hypothetical protein
MAVVPFEDAVLLIRLRTPVNSDPAEAAVNVASFEEMLAAVNFTGGTPTPTASPTG